MTARQGSVRVYQHEQTVTFQIEGQATMQQVVTDITHPVT